MAQNETRRGTRIMPTTTPVTTPGGGVVVKGAGQTVQAMMRTNDLRGGRSPLTQMASSAVVRTAPKVYSPLYEMSNLMLPRDLRTMNSWIRHFYNSNPIVRNAINLHATYPISKFEITCRDPKVKNFFIDQADHIDLTGLLLSISLEWWKHGECFPYMELDENRGWWDYGFCFKKGSSVITASGEEKKIEEVQIGDRFVTHLGRVREVSKTFVREVDEEIVAIYVKNNIPVEVTREHKVRFVKKKDITDYIEDSTLEVPERTAQELQKGDYVIYPKIDKVKDNDEFSKEFCKLCGYFLAEGTIGYKKESKEPYYVEISFHKDDQESITEVCELIEKIYGSYEKRTYKSETITKQYVRQNNPDLVSVTVNLKEVAEQFTKMFGRLGGTLSHQKSMPEEILYLPIEKQWELLVGYFNGDGGVNKNGDGFITTVSPHLAAQVHWLLARNGIFASRYTYPPSESGNYEVHRLSLTINDTHKLKSYVATVKRKYMKIARTNVSVLENDNFYFIPVRKTELIQYKGTVHNVTVDEDHTLLTRTFAISQCHNPDYIRVKTNVLTREPIITMVPDDSLRRLAQTQNAADRALREQLPQDVLYHLKRGEDIPLPSFNVAHLKMLSSDYDIRGTSIIVSVFKDLMLYDKIREAKLAQADNFINPITLVKLGASDGCYDDQTSVLTDRGWLMYSDVTTKDKIACFNRDTRELEYHCYTKKIEYDYEGDMIHFDGRNMDQLLTPNHWCWNLGRDKVWQLKEAKDVRSKTKFRTTIEPTKNENEVSYVEIAGKQVDADVAMKFVGSFVSEGFTHIEEKRKYRTCFVQAVKGKAIEGIKAFNAIATVFNCKLLKYISTNKTCLNGKLYEEDRIDLIINNEGLARYCRDKFGERAANKKIPKEIRNLPAKNLKVLLHAAIEGDGCQLSESSWSYASSSEELADNIQEIAFKCGYYTTKQYYKYSKKVRSEFNNATDGIFRVFISRNLKGHSFPLLRAGRAFQKQKRIKQYKGKVWCFEVPTHLFVTRRNGKIAIQGNSWKPNDQDIVNFRNAWMESTYDPDAKLITHGAVTVEKVSNAGQTLDMSSDLELIIKNLYAGLMMPEAIMNGEGSTYNSASIGLEVLRARYERFRNLITRWIMKKVFEPISKIQDFYEYKDGEKKLIVPEVQWNKINLKDTDSYWTAVSSLLSEEPGKSRVSKRTAFNVLDIDPDSEEHNLKEEAVRDFIRNKEIERLSKMTLEELKTLDVTKPIPDMHPDQAAGGEGAEGAGGGDAEGLGDFGSNEGGEGLGGGLDLGELGGEAASKETPTSTGGGEQ